MNGAIGLQQYRWLQAELEEATLKEERVIILSHVLLSQRPTGADEEKEMCSLWNFPTLVRLFHSPIGRCVAACIHGHDHKGGYWQDPTGLHTIVLQASLEAEGDIGPYVVLEAHSDRLVFRGYENSSLFGDEVAVHGGERRRELTVRPLNADEEKACECEWCQVVPSDDRWWEWRHAFVWHRRRRSFGSCCERASTVSYSCRVFSAGTGQKPPLLVRR